MASSVNGGFGGREPDRASCLNHFARSLTRKIAAARTSYIRARAMLSALPPRNCYLSESLPHMECFYSSPLSLSSLVFPPIPVLPLPGTITTVGY
jgi:hypothetical protein